MIEEKTGNLTRVKLTIDYFILSAFICNLPKARFDALENQRVLL